MLRSSVIITSSVSIVKELVENSLDAKSSHIHVQIDSTTIGDMIVKDNGTGIEPEDRPLLAVANATSKISSFEEIQNTKSFGFRGEALSAIADISESGSNHRMVITTRTKDEQMGTSWSVDRNGVPIVPYI